VKDGSHDLYKKWYTTLYKEFLWDYFITFNSNDRYANFSFIKKFLR
jgi:hypothetical protein